MDISYEYDVQDVLINSRKARPEPEPNWRSMYEEKCRENLRLKNKTKKLYREKEIYKKRFLDNILS